MEEKMKGTIIPHKDLKPGQVFKYNGAKNPIIYFKGPRSQLMPTLVMGEKPKQTNGSKNEFAFVEILWDPDDAHKKLGTGRYK